MELIEVIKTRRAVREYTDARVDRTTVERLLGAAVLAPSAMNLQPWAFAVLLDRERINNYARRAKDWLLTKHELGLPADHHVVAPIVLGYPKAWPESHGRNPAEIHWLD